MRWWLAIALIFSLSAFADVLDNQFLSYKEASELWNVEPFSPVKFKAAKPDDRGGFALDIINHDNFTGKKISEVKKLLGNPDGTYKGHNVLAYQLGSDDKNSYQLVFLPDFQGKVVENIKIYHEAIDESKSMPTSISVGGKRLPIVIEGQLAESIFKHLRVNETRSIKTGKNIACNKGFGHYRCSFELDDSGAAFAK